MSDLRELYQDVILDHSKRPRNFGPLECATSSANGANPLCGDLVTVHVQLRDGVVEDIHFEGSGCAISTASASLMTQILKGKSAEEVKDVFERFHVAVTSPPDTPLDLAALGKLQVLAGVREFPLRVKCASLAWHTMRAALDRQHDTVSTE